jgi:hypothetical protein
MESGTKNARCRWMAVALAMFTWMTPFARTTSREDTVGELKERVANANLSERPALCIRICERQLDAADRLYVAGDTDNGRAMLADVTAFAEQARDYAIQSHKHEKQSEIAIRKMTRKLTNLKHTVAHEDQSQIQDAIDRLQRIRDDLLTAMFPNGVNK